MIKKNKKLLFKKENKELLLKDLCARLPYGVKVESVFINTDTKKHKLCGIDVFEATCILMIRDGFGEFKPYLFPLSSMTEKQKKEYQYITERWMNDPSYSISDSIDWLNENHFDYRGLIEKGLAIDATGTDIYDVPEE